MKKRMAMKAMKEMKKKANKSMMAVKKKVKDLQGQVKALKEANSKLKRQNRTLDECVTCYYEMWLNREL